MHTHIAKNLFQQRQPRLKRVGLAAGWGELLTVRQAPPLPKIHSEPSMVAGFPAPVPCFEGATIRVMTCNLPPIAAPLKQRVPEFKKLTAVAVSDWSQPSKNLGRGSANRSAIFGMLTLPTSSAILSNVWVCC